MWECGSRFRVRQAQPGPQRTNVARGRRGYRPHLPPSAIMGLGRLRQRDPPCPTTPTRTSARLRSISPARAARGRFAIQASRPTHQPARPRACVTGMAAACDEIVRDPQGAFDLTARGNLVGVVTNGTAVLDRQYRRARRQASDGRQGCAVQENRRPRLLDIELNRHDCPTSSSTSSSRSSRPSAASTSRTSRAHECFYIERKCPRAGEDPGLPRRPAWHGDHHQRRRCERPAS